MNSCPSSVSNRSIVLGGGRSLREVGCVAESASRSFYLLLGACADLFICRERKGRSDNLQGLLDDQQSLNWCRVVLVGILWQETNDHFLSTTWSRLRAAGLFHRGMSLVVDLMSSLESLKTKVV
jgi:hypothetical protein